MWLHCVYILSTGALVPASADIQNNVYSLIILGSHSQIQPLIAGISPTFLAITSNISTLDPVCYSRSPIQLQLSIISSVLYYTLAFTDHTITESYMMLFCITKTLLVCILSAGAQLLPYFEDDHIVYHPTISGRSAPKMLQKRGRGSVW